MMNRFERDFDGEARLQYGDSDYMILKPGRFVRCAVTDAKIPIEDLRYWSAERQEAYVDADAALKRWRQTHETDGAA